MLLVTGVSNAFTPISGSTPVNLVGVDGRIINAIIDWSVTDLASYPAGQLPVGPNGAYVYEYVLHNLQTSTVKLDLLSVAAEEFASISSIGTYGSAPAFNAFTEITEWTPGTNQSAKFVFAKFTIPGAGSFGDGPLGIGADSYKLIFTSDYAPKIGTALVTGGTVGGTAPVPTPVPEPITAVLLGLGGLIASRRRLG